MKNLLLTLMLLLSAAASAQNNPYHGYIITNSGDTIQGMLDLKMNSKMSKTCTFKADGESEVKDYAPGEIEGYRFDDNGKYFVTRRLTVKDVEGLYFAEFVVNGKMNLYCVTIDNLECYFLEHEDGTMAQITNRPDLVAYDWDIIAEKRREYAKAKALFIESPKAMHEFNDKDMSRKRLMSIVQDYHNDVCTDGSKCVVYEYNSKSERIYTHMKAFAGYAYITEMSDQQHFEGQEYSAGAPEFGIGLEVDLSRIFRGFSAEIMLSYSHFKASEAVVEKISSRPLTTLSEHRKDFYTLSVVADQCLFKGGVQPLVRAGLFASFTHNPYEKLIHTEYPDRGSELKWGSCIHFGAILGVGVHIPIKKHYIRIHGDWYHSLESTTKMTKYAATLEFAY